MPVTYLGIFFGDWFHLGGGVGELVMHSYGSRAKPWWGPDGKAPESSKVLILWNILLFIKIYPSQPVMKLIQYIFFSKILPKITPSLTCKDLRIYKLPITMYTSENILNYRAFLNTEFGHTNWYTGF